MKLTGFSILAPALAAMSAAMLAVPAAAQGGPASLEGFQLPPSPQRTPQVQGPVAEGIPSPRAPRPSPSAAPAAAPSPAASSAPASAPASAPTPGPSPAPASSATPPGAPPAAISRPTGPDSTATPRAPANSNARAAAQPIAQPGSASPVSIPQPDIQGPAAQPASPAALPTAASVPAPTQSIAPDLPSTTGESSNWWAWLIAGFILAWLSGGLLWLYRQRHETGGRMIAPPIERPRPRPAVPGHGPAPAQSANLPTDAATPLDDPAEAEPEPAAAFPENCALRCTLEATRLSLTLMNATLTYRLTLANDSASSIRNIIIGGDLVTAHASVPIDQQIAEPGQNLQQQHHIPLLLPDQNAQLSGEFRLPIPAIHALRRKDAVMFVPLLRLRIDAEDMDQIALQTLVIGQSPAGPGAGLRPFRLDLGPRIYGDIGHRLLAPRA